MPKPSLLPWITACFNFIHDYMGDGIYDGGAIYTLGNSNGDGYNLIHDNYVRNQMNRTGVLYADEGSTYWKFLHNVVDVSETTKWSGGWSPYWASISAGTEHIEYSGTPMSTGVTGITTRFRLWSKKD